MNLIKEVGNALKAILKGFGIGLPDFFEKIGLDNSLGFRIAIFVTISILAIFGINRKKK